MSAMFGLRFIKTTKAALPFWKCKIFISKNRFGGRVWPEPSTKKQRKRQKVRVRPLCGPGQERTIFSPGYSMKSSAFYPIGLSSKRNFSPCFPWKKLNIFKILAPEQGFVRCLVFSLAFSHIVVKIPMEFVQYAIVFVIITVCFSLTLQIVSDRMHKA